MNNTFDKIEELASTKSYSQLNTQEKDIVSKHFDSPEEYDDFAFFTQNGIPQINSGHDKPSEEIKDKLLFAFDSRNGSAKQTTKLGLFAGIFSAVSLQQLGLKTGIAAAALIGTTLFINEPNNSLDLEVGGNTLLVDSSSSMDTNQHLIDSFQIRSFR